MSYLITQFIPALKDMFMAKWLLTSLLMFLRYALFAGVPFVIFYMWRKRENFFRKIQQKYPERKRITYEVKYSLSSFAILGLIVSAMSILIEKGYSKLYFDFSEHSWLYFAFTIVASIVLHDTYFYWTHRAMHHPKVFKHVHKVHHMSNNPTPWAAFSFHPIEAVVEFSIAPILIFLMPIHPVALLLFGLYMITLNVMGHLGFELFPKGFTQHWFFKWFNTSTHHNMHHKKVRCNYGLYYNFWDRVMGTNHAEYDKTFEEVKARPRPVFDEEEDADKKLEPSPLRTV